MLEAKDELKGLIKEICDGTIRASQEEFNQKWEKLQEQLKGLGQEERKAIEKRIEAIESAPIVKRSLVIPGTNKTTEMYLGHKLALQFSDVFKGNRLGYAKEVVANPKLFPIIADDEKREGMAKHLLMVVKAALGNVKAKMDYEDFEAKHPNQKAALAEGTDAYGGYWVPDEYANEILAFARLQSVALQDCRVWPMGSDVRRIPSELTSVTVDWATEGNANSESEPTAAEVVLTAKRLGAFSIASNEVLNDANIDIASYLTEIFSEATGQELDNQVFNGTGSPWSGVLTAKAGYSVVLGSGSAAFSMIVAGNLLSMIDAIPVQAEAGAKFYFHKKILTFIRNLKNSNGDYLFSPMSGLPPTDIFGYPYTRVNKCPSTSGASTAFALLGNLRAFALGRRLEGMTLDLDPYGKFTEYQTRFRLVQRWGGAVGLANAFCRLITAA